MIFGNKELVSIGNLRQGRSALAAAATKIPTIFHSICWLLSANPLPKGAAYAYSGFASRGGVSHCDARRLRGQSTIEYVLLIAIIALVVIIAGPGVASAIRNQFSTVTDAMGSGTVGENFYDAVDLPDPQNGTAFAVYSEDDHSLMFYKRRGVPKVGDIFNYRTVSEVYTGFETDEYSGTWPQDDCPWYPIANSVRAVSVVDAIRPKSIAWWFNQFKGCTTFDLGKIDTSLCTSFRRLFSSCSDTTSISGMEKWDTSNVIDLAATFDGLLYLKEIPGISNWNTRHVRSFDSTFFNLSNLERLDLSGWSTGSFTTGSYFGHHGYPASSKLQYVKVGADFGDTAAMMFNVTLSMDVDGFDGKWYALSDGKGYAPGEIPSHKADTYFVTKMLRDAAARG